MAKIVRKSQTASSCSLPTDVGNKGKNVLHEGQEKSQDTDKLREQKYGSISASTHNLLNEMKKPSILASTQKILDDTEME